MLARALLRTPLRKPPSPFLRNAFSRRFATEPPPTAQSRIERFNRRMPKFLHKYTNALASAPLSHITAFLLLHEITAVVPLIGLAATFHYTQWLPPWFAEGAWVFKGVDMFGSYFRRKGWIRSDQAAVAEAEAQLQMRRRDRIWNLGEGGTRWVVEFATAYAVTKVLLPVRIVFSVWGTPWFARWTVIPLMSRVKRLFGRGKKAPSKAAGGTGAVDAGVVSKSVNGKGKGS